MVFFTTAITGLKVVVTAIGGGVGVWGVINLLEGYGNDNPGAKSQGMKQLIRQSRGQKGTWCEIWYSRGNRGFCLYEGRKRNQGYTVQV